MATLPAVGPSVDEAVSDAGTAIEAVDVLEPYAPFPHIEAILTEELGLFERGAGAAACARGETRPDGQIPVSPSGGCIGRGHPAMVTPLLNYVGAVRQIRGTASTQVPDVETVLTTSEHGHVDGMTTTIIEAMST
jgi:acetyl-CoA acetyltransferase